MKILVVIPSYKPAYGYGGPIFSVSTLCEKLANGGHEVLVLTTNANGKSKLPFPPGKPMHIDGVEVIYFNRWTRDHSNFSPALIRYFWRHHKKYDLVHIQAWWNLISIPVLMLCRLKNICFLLSPRGSLTAYTLHHGSGRMKQLFHHLAGRRILGDSVFHVTSRKEKEDVDILAVSRASFVIPNMLFLPAAGVYTSLEKDKFRLLMLGRIDPKKNIEFMLDVVNKLEGAYELVIAGSGEKHYVEYLQQRVKDQRDVRWTGQAEGPEKWKLIAGADLLVMPSFNENYGNVVLEALSQGTAVLVSDHVGIKDYISSGNLGWVVPLDEDSWKSKIDFLVHHRDELQRIRQTAPLLIQKDFGTAHLLSRYEEMYHYVSARKN